MEDKIANQDATQLEMVSPPKPNLSQIEMVLPDLNSSIQQIKTHDKFANVIGTEILIDKMLSILGHDGDDLKNWPMDTIPNEKVRKNLSYSKMLNEINHREGRILDKEGLS